LADDPKNTDFWTVLQVADNQPETAFMSFMAFVFPCLFTRFWAF
jgi:hypothetical protein